MVVCGGCWCFLLFWVVFGVAFGDVGVFVVVLGFCIQDTFKPHIAPIGGVREPRPKFQNLHDWTYP